MRDNEGINAHLGGIFKVSISRVRSDGLVKETKKENPTAPLSTRRKTAIAKSCPEKIHVVPVRKITSGVIPHNRLVSERVPPTIIYSKNMRVVMIASGIGSNTIKKVN